MERLEGPGQVAGVWSRGLHAVRHRTGLEPAETPGQTVQDPDRLDQPAGGRRRGAFSQVIGRSLRTLIVWSAGFAGITRMTPIAGGSP